MAKTKTVRRKSLRGDQPRPKVRLGFEILEDRTLPSGFSVLASAPAVNATVNNIPVDYTVNFSAPVDAATIDAGDFKVTDDTGTPHAADSFAVNNSTQVNFHFNLAPFSTQGLHSMTMAAGSVLRSGDGNPLETFSGQFRYDAMPLTVASTSPAANSTVTLPAPLTFVVNFNEPITANSVGIDDLTVSVGSVTAALASGPSQATYTISGIDVEGALNVNFAAGRVTDLFGNPNPVDFGATYTLDYGTIAFPTPPAAVQPLGSLVYNTSGSGTIGSVGDTDSFTLNFDAGQQITVVVHPTVSSLQPVVNLNAPNNAILAIINAAAPNQDAVVESVDTTAGGTYTITVAGAGSTTGSYTVQVILNAAEELERHNGLTNNTPATAQNIDGSFLSLGGSASRGAVLGGNDTVPSVIMYQTDFENGAGGFTIDNNVPGRAPGLWHLSTRRGSETGHSASTSFYYGSESAGNYVTAGQANAGSITSAPIVLPNTNFNLLLFKYVLLTQSAGSGDIASVQVSNDGGVTFGTSVRLSQSASWTSANVDLSDFAGQTILIRFNFDTVDANNNAFEGFYVDDVQLYAKDTWKDYYALTVAAGDTMSLALKQFPGDVSNVIYNANVFVEDGSGTVMASGVTGATNYDRGISDFTFATAGTYFLRVSGSWVSTYSLTVTRNGDFDTEPNNGIAQPQELLGRPVLGEQDVLGQVSVGGDLTDTYAVHLGAGGTLTAETGVPAGGPGEFVNTLDPRLRVLDSLGNQLAIDDNSAGDGINALLTFTNNGPANVFFVEVSSTPVVITGGEYVLRVTGNTLTAPPFLATNANVANGAVINNAPSVYTVNFNDVYLATSVQAGDLQVDGIAATGFLPVDGDTVSFVLPGPLGQGGHVISMAAGAILDVQGTPLQAFSTTFSFVTFSVDATGPRVLASSLAPNAVVTSSAVTYQATFSKPLLPTNLSTTDLRVFGSVRNVKYVPDSFTLSSDHTVLTITFLSLPDDNYTLTLPSSFIVDSAGNGLDGEFSGTFPSGNGIVGGDFVLGFKVDAASIAFPTPLQPVLPLGSLIYSDSFAGLAYYVGDSASYKVNVDAGQKITALVMATDANAFRPIVTLIGPDNTVLATATSPAAGREAAVENVSATTGGIYTVTITGAANTKGTYKLQIVLNGAEEIEELQERVNNTAATAQNIDGSFLSLGGVATGGAVVGTTNVAPDQDYYSLTLSAGDTISVAAHASNSNISVQLTDNLGNVLATALPGPTNSDVVLTDLTVAANGTYCLEVIGSSNTYGLVIVKNAEFNNEPNDAVAQAQEMLSRQAATEQYALGYVSPSGDALDVYKVHLGAGQALDARTFTPADGSGEFINALDPRLRILDAAGAQLAIDDNGGLDGKNAHLLFTNTGAAGVFFVEVSCSAATATAGEYLLRLAGNTFSPSSFQVATSTPANGAAVAPSATTFVVNFNVPFLATSVQAADLRVDGNAATGITPVDGDSIAFTIPGPFNTGTHTVTIAAGAILGIQGTPLAAYSSTFTVENIGPRVIATSLAPGALLTSRPLVYQVTFSEPIRTNPMPQFQLSGSVLYNSDVISSFDASGTVLTLTLQNPPDDHYTVTLQSLTGDAPFFDVAGNALDGEFNGTFPSGDGVAGGTFAISFNVGMENRPYPSGFPSTLPLGGLTYDASSDQKFGAAGKIVFTGDNDRYTLNVDPGQKITVVVQQISSSLQPTVALSGPGNVVVGSATAPAAGRDAVLETVDAASGGLFTITVGGANATLGQYRVEVILNAAEEIERHNGPSNNTTATAQNIDGSFLSLGGSASRGAVLGTLSSTSDADYYGFTLAAGDTVSLAVAALNSGTVNVQLDDSNGAALANAMAGPANLKGVLTDFTAPAAGTYYLAITGATSSTTYNVVITKNAEFNTELNDTFTQAQRLLSRQVAGDQYALGYVGGFGDPTDVYQINLNAGATLTAMTTTPGGGDGEFGNTLDPRLRVLDSQGNQVGFDDNSALDGKNAQILFNNPGPSGVFYVEVSPSPVTASLGEYVLRITGNTAPSAFHVTASNPTNGAALGPALTTYTVQFNNLYQPASVQASDLKVDGVSATGVTLVDADTVSFTLATPLGQGSHAVNIAGGAILDAQGTALSPFANTFFLEQVAPRVTAVSIAPNGIVAPGSLALQVTFSEPMKTFVNGGDYSLRGNLRPGNYRADSLTYDPSGTKLTLTFTGLPDDNYTLSLLPPGSGTSISDVAGHVLDGEFAGTFPSGDGSAGGPFVFVFNMDVASEAFPTPLMTESSQASLIYDNVLTRTIAYADDNDNYPLAVDFGQTVAVSVKPATTLQTIIELRDPSNVLVASATAVAAGAPAFLNYPSPTTAGTYTITIRGAAGTVGLYTAEAVLNAALEAENSGGAVNDSRGSAQNIDATFIALHTAAASATRGAVLGGNGAGAPFTVFQTNFENGASGYTIDNDNGPGAASGFWHLSTRRGTQAGHSGVTSFYYGRESTGIYDTPGYSNAGVITSTPITLPDAGPITLSFNYVLQTNAYTLVLVSNDGGETFNEIRASVSSVYLAQSATWRNTSLDLSAYAGQTILLRFSFTEISTSGNAEGWYIDDLQITAPSTWTDSYSFTAAANESVAVGLRMLAGNGAAFAVENSSGTVVASGVGNVTEDGSVTGNFVVDTGGTFFMRVSGASAATYSVVVTRNAALEIEAHDSFTTAQDVSGTRGVLGSIPPAAHSIVVPNAFTNTEGNGATSVAFNISQSTRYQQLYDHTQFTSAGTITALRFRRDGKEGQPFTTTGIDVKINLGYSGVPYYAPTGSFAANVGANVTTVFDGLLSLSSTGAGQPNAFDIVIHLTTPFYFDPARGDLLLDVFMRKGQLTTVFDTVVGIPNAPVAMFGLHTSSVHEYAVGAVTGGVEAVGFVTMFDMTPSSAEDWYAVNVTNTTTPLRIDTSTPVDGPNQSANTLNPQIELYGPGGSSGTLLASGTALADGRNEIIVYQPLVSGVYRIRVTAQNNTAGTYFLSKNSGPLIVPARFTVSAPSSATAGSAFSVTVTALDSSNNIALNYFGIVHFTSSDSQAALPGDLALNNGVGIINVTLKTAGSQTLTVADRQTTSITGTTNPIAVSTQAATHFVISAPASATAGNAFDITVTALDQFGNVATSYAGSVRFSSSDFQAVLPATSTLTGGAGTFSVILKTAGSRILTVADTVTNATTGTSSAISVKPAAANHFALTGAPSNTIAGTAFNVTVTALDPFNNTAAGYSGTVHYASSDGKALLPADRTLTSGVGTFSTTLKTAGSQTMSAVDTVATGITGSRTLSVSAAAASRFTLNAPLQASPGAAFSVTLTARDPFNNPVTGYAGTVHFTTSDTRSGVVIPGNYTFAAIDAGVHTFSGGVILVSTGLQTVTATDVATSSMTGSASLSVVEMLSIPANLVGSRGGIVTAPINISALYDPVNGNAGLSGGDFVVLYDANAFVVSSTDVHLGSLPSAISGWSLLANTDTPGQIVIGLSKSGSGTFTATGGGSLVTIDFHVKSNALLGVANTIDLAADLLSSLPLTHVSDVNGRDYTFAPAPADGADPNDGAITIVNQAPAASGDLYSITERVSPGDPSLTVASPGVLANDVELDGDPMTAVKTGNPAHGSVTLGSDGSFIYTPDLGYRGPDSFTYKASDGLLDSSVVTVNLIVTSRLSIPSDLSGIPGGTVLVPVNVDNPNPVGSGGLTAATLAINFDPNVFSVNNSDVQLGTLTNGWSLTADINATAGQIGIELSSGTPLTGIASGSLALIAFHIKANTPGAFTAINLVATNSPNGTAFTTHLETANGALPLRPAPSNAATDPGVDGVVTVIGASHFAIVAAAGARAGSASSFTVTALDQFNHTDTNYTGTVHFTSSDGQAIVPVDATLNSGVGTFSITFKTIANQTLSGTDTANGVTGTSSAITVVAAAADHFSVTAPAAVTFGSAFNFAVTAFDAFGNTATAYSGTVHFTSSDVQASLPANATLAGGTGYFSATLKTAGNQTLTATDSAVSTIMGTSNIISPAATHFTFGVPSSIMAGNNFLFTVTAKDQFNGTVGGYTGTVHIDSSDGQAVLSGDATFVGGSGFFAAILRTAGNQTLTAADAANSNLTGTSSGIAVSSAPMNHLGVTTPANAATGIPISFAVQALDPYNNVVPGYAGAIHFTSSDTAASLPSDAILTSGSGSFAATLKTVGNQIISATDTIASSIAGNSNLITVRGLMVTTITPTPTGFAAQFNKPFDPAGLNLYDSFNTFGAADVTLVGPSGVIRGSLLVNSTNTGFTFIKTGVGTTGIFAGVLPAGSYSVAVRSGVDGFKDNGGGKLDGNGDGIGGDNYVAAFAVQASSNAVLSIPDFARGPDGASNIKVPNNTGTGIPITLSNAVNVADATFTLSYNPALLTISGALNGPSGTFSLLGTPSGGVASFSFHSTSALSGKLTLGQIVAQVPNSAANNYKTRELLHLSSILLNGNNTSTLNDDGLHVNAYFGDASGDGTFSPLDATLIARTAINLDTGFAAHRLVDPSIIGDVNNNSFADSTDVTLLNRSLAGIAATQIPVIPIGMSVTPTGLDPALSLPTDLVAAHGEAVVVPVMIDTARPEGSSGMLEAILALRYDPRVFTVSASDIHLGSLPLAGLGWQLRTEINALTGEIGIDIYSALPITTTDSGSLVTVTMHVRENAPAGATAINLVHAVNPTGQRSYVTSASDAVDPFVLHPAVTDDADASVDGQIAIGTERSRVNEDFETQMFNDLVPANSSLRPPTSAVRISAREQVFADLPGVSLLLENELGRPGGDFDANPSDMKASNVRDLGIVHQAGDGVFAVDLSSGGLSIIGQTLRRRGKMAGTNLLDYMIADSDSGEVAVIDKLFAGEYK